MYSVHVQIIALMIALLATIKWFMTHIIQCKNSVSLSIRLPSKSKIMFI